MNIHLCVANRMIFKDIKISHHCFKSNSTTMRCTVQQLSWLPGTNKFFATLRSFHLRNLMGLSKKGRHLRYHHLSSKSDHFGISFHIPGNVSAHLSSQAIVADLPKMVGCQGKVLLRDWLCEQKDTMPGGICAEKSRRLDVLLMLDVSSDCDISWSHSK